MRQVGAGKGCRVSSLKGALQTLCASILWTASFLLFRVLLGGVVVVGLSVVSGGGVVEHSRVNTQTLAGVIAPTDLYTLTRVRVRGRDQRTRGCIRIGYDKEE